MRIPAWAQGALFTLVAAGGLPGCALVTDTVDVRYQSAVAAAPVPGAERAVVQVATTEGRSGRPDQISSKKNGYGMEMAAILSSRLPTDLVRDAITEELRKEGFRIGQGAVTVSAEVTKFSNDFKTGFFSADAAGEVTLGIQVRSAAGQILYSRTVTGEGLVTGVQLMGGNNAKDAVEKALSAAVARLVSDQAFTRALLDAGRPQAGSPAS